MELITDDQAWLPIARPIRPQTCVGCGGVSLRGFLFCGWCGEKLKEDTQIAASLPMPPAPEPPTPGEAPPPAVMQPSLSGYAVDPVDFPSSEKITLVRWPGDGHPAQEITQPSAPIEVEDTARKSASEDTDPRARPAEFRDGGLCVVVLGNGPTGEHQPASDVQMLAIGDDLDVITAESGSTTSFRVEADGLRVEELGAERAVARRFRGHAGLRSGDAFRLGQTWLVYSRHEGREAFGIYGRVYVLAPSGHVVTFYEVGESGLVLGTSLGDPTLAFDKYIARRHCRLVAGATGATLEDLGSPDGTFVAVAAGELIPLGSIAVFADTVVRIDPLG